MRVKFARLWFGPDGARYREGVNEVPASLKDKLPSTAKVLDEDEPAPEPAPAKK